jgi:hypothetical protein
VRSVTFTLPAVAVVMLAVLLVRPDCGPAGCRAKREPVSKLLSPVPPESLAIQERWRVKRDLARRVIAERIPLLESAALFRRANGEDGLQNLAAIHPGESLHKLICRQVIDYVDTREREMEQEGHTWTGPRVSECLRREFDLRAAAGEFSPAAEHAP